MAFKQIVSRKGSQIGIDALDSSYKYYLVNNRPISEITNTKFIPAQQVDTPYFWETKLDSEIGMENRSSKPKITWKSYGIDESDVSNIPSIYGAQVDYAENCLVVVIISHPDTVSTERIPSFETLGYIQDYATGELVRIDTEKQKFWLRQLNQSILEVSYSGVENAESVLHGNPQGVIQIHGAISYNENNEIVSIGQVDQVLEIDTSPIEISEIKLDGGIYRAEPSLMFEVNFEYEEYFYALEGDFEIIVTGESRYEIEDALNETLNILWTDYAQGSLEKLAPHAVKLKNSLLERFKAVE